MDILPDLFNNNHQWSEQRKQQDPLFFRRLSKQQTPKYLWIGCSDSRIPANEVVGLQPGELFVHRNIANVVVHTDLNCLSVLQYAVEVLKVEHVIVCGHYGCGGVAAASKNSEHGLIDNWLRNIKDVYQNSSKALENIDDEELRLERLCELNVEQQVNNVCHTSIVQNAWQRRQPLTIHGWIYRMEEGLLQNLDLSISYPDQMASVYRVSQ